MVPPIDVLLFDPDSFFDRQDARSWGGPATVIAVLSIVQLIAAYPPYKQVQQLYANVGGGFVETLSLVSSVFGALFGPLLFCLLVAGTAYIVTAVFDGEGPFGETFQVAAWGLVPHVIGTIVSAVATYMNWINTDIQPIPASADPSQYQEFSSQITGSVTDPLMLATTIVGLVTLFWGGYIWMVGVETVRNVDRRYAVAAIALWIVLPVLTKAWSLFQIASM